ncbi:MAG: hypothetical protein DRH97_04270 [Chloroflexi bacterium]|nr:MAG: hypothetical protein DRH97_04270 [Chloroflexota bacterium]
MQIKKSKTQYLWTTILIIVALFVWVLSFSGVATADMYSDSAHGNSLEGVNRLSAEYDIGDCANCHDTFDDTTCGVKHRMLFNAEFVNQKSGVCMKCHQEAASHQEGGVLYNYDYSRVRGGETTKDCPASIRKQFWFIKYDTRLPRIHCDLTEPIGSAHDLKDIRAYMKNKWGWGGTNIEVNPCGTCHNPHKTTKDYPCSLPSSHSSTWEIWGDGIGEKMVDYADDLGGVYQPPYKVGWTPEEPKYEWTDDNQAPDYNTLCMDCHQDTIDSHRWGDLISLAWFEQNFSTTGWQGNRHGAQPRDPGSEQGTLKAPYTADEDTNYILMCTDCHEPHGSKNYMLLRTCVNGTEDLSIPPFSDPFSTPEENEDWVTWCQACHTLNVGHLSWTTCKQEHCHNHYTYGPYGKF